MLNVLSSQMSKVKGQMLNVLSSQMSKVKGQMLNVLSSQMSKVKGQMLLVQHPKQLIQSCNPLQYFSEPVFRHICHSVF
jgi:hypothetical protein